MPILKKLYGIVFFISSMDFFVELVDFYGVWYVYIDERELLDGKIEEFFWRAKFIEF